MTNLKKIAFFAPIKPPDHPIPSGDRLIAGNLLKAMSHAGFEPHLASRYICYSKRSSLDILRERKSGALKEAKRLIDHYSNLSDNNFPDIWVSYHPYCKAPDWIGPLVSKALNIPYVTIEAAKTGQGQNDEWLPWRMEAQEGIKQADMHLCFKPTDKVYLTELLGSSKKLFDLPSFIDLHEVPSSNQQTIPETWRAKEPILVTTGMMRPGKKVRNFEILAEVMKGLTDLAWKLIIIGGGPEEANIKSMFRDIDGSRILWTGLIDHVDVLGWMQASDIFIWPGWKEPIGMVYLEAQLQGLPVIASNSMGVPLVVEDGKSGLLSPEEEISQMQINLTTLLNEPERVSKMGAYARQKVQDHHSIEAAAKRLKEVFSNL